MWKYLRGVAVAALGFGLLSLGPVSCKQQRKTDYKNITAEQGIQDSIINQVNDFYFFVKDTFHPAVENNADPDSLQHYFLKARLLFKKFEWAAEYFMGATTEAVNGEPDPEVENADLLDPNYAKRLDPSGLQIMEEFIFPQYDSSKKDDLLKQLDLLESNSKIYKTYFTDKSLTDWRILDAAKQEVFRILTLGIVGFDNELTLNSMAESAASMKSLKGVLSHFKLEEGEDHLIQNIDGAIDYLEDNPDFDSFDRAEFITEYGNAISTGITELERQIGYPVRYNRMLRQQAKTLFDTNAFNLNAFVPGKEFYLTEEKAALGKKLFHDSSLSGTGTRSCATCHLPDQSFTDGLKKHPSIHDDSQLIRRHTPTLLNAALQSNYFFDMRALTLEDQANDVIHNEEEMDGTMANIVTALRQDERYEKLFAKAFPKKKEQPVDSVGVLNALASYVRTLTKLNSRFDQYMRGDEDALTQKEINGFNLFMGKAKCATCHFMPTFNGMTPPKYVESEAEVIGVPKSIEDTVIDPDRGWYDVIGVSYYKYAFKTPTVRNASKIAPYMHNGIYKDLEQLMDFYNNAGGGGMGIELWNQTLPEDSLHLTDKEIAEVIDFMESLDSQ